MPVKIRLMRIGATKRPFYRVVAVDERRKRTGGYLELLGTYNPIVEPKEIILKQDRIDDWIKKGAVMSDGFLRIIGKAPQRPPRKVKKQKEEPKAPAATAAPAEDQSSEQPVAAEENTEPAVEVAETPVESPEAPAAESEVAEAQPSESVKSEEEVS
jgi:small subunit ribosomal protein S16